MFLFHTCHASMRRSHAVGWRFAVGWLFESRRFTVGGSLLRWTHLHPQLHLRRLLLLAELEAHRVRLCLAPERRGAAARVLESIKIKRNKQQSKSNEQTKNTEQSGLLV
jgi:hypothetical protein